MALLSTHVPVALDQLQNFFFLNDHHELIFIGATVM